MWMVLLRSDFLHDRQPIRKGSLEICHMRSAVWLDSPLVILSLDFLQPENWFFKPLAVIWIVQYKHTPRGIENLAFVEGHEIEGVLWIINWWIWEAKGGPFEGKSLLKLEIEGKRTSDENCWKIACFPLTFCVVKSLAWSRREYYFLVQYMQLLKHNLAFLILTVMG